MPSLLLAVRDPLADAKDTLSSWDKCMAKSYCKWPVIVAIIIGGLIILSIVLCVARCVCCGAELACCCFKCCTCCCPAGGRSGHRRVKSEPPPPAYHPTAYSSAPPAPAAPVDTRPANQQYRSHNAPAFNPVPVPETPQYARFDAPSKPVNEDALPAMPTMKDAKDVHVQEEVIPEKRGDMEMDTLDRNGSAAGNTAVEMAVSSTARRSPGPERSPVHRSLATDSYGFPASYVSDSYGNVAPRRSPHNSPGPYGGTYGQRQEEYRGAPPGQALSPRYGAGSGYAQNQQYDRRSPGPGYNAAYRQPSPAPDHSPVSSEGYGYEATQWVQEPVLIPEHCMYQGDSYSNGSARANSPGYAPSGSTRYEPSGTTYPGQELYQPSQPSYPGQQTYHAYQPGQPQGQQISGVQRKAVEGSWRDV